MMIGKIIRPLWTNDSRIHFSFHFAGGHGRAIMRPETEVPVEPTRQASLETGNPQPIRKTSEIDH
jgi:hypothetical protein